MTRLGFIAALAALVALAACAENTPDTTDGAIRAVSLDYCADQYALKLLEADEILALSPDAEKKFSYLRKDAAGMRKVNPRAEEVLALRPNLVLRSYGGGPNAPAFFERAGIKVVQIGYANTLSEIVDITRAVGTDLDRRKDAEHVITQMNNRIAVAADRHKEKDGLYYTAGGVVAGPGSLPHDLLRAAGYDNFETAPGWHPIPLERLAGETPDLAIAAFFDDAGSPQNAWSIARHPLARQQLSTGENIRLESAWTACGGWFAVDAVEALAAAHKRAAE